MKKNYVSPRLEVLRIKQGNVVMNSHGGTDCWGENIFDDSCHECVTFCQCDGYDT